ncbi:ester cyclase [Candidatus Regiella endosymbiont of Tuberolachnus salignus]|uniref:ester cyclase n=1 Tax=Candidatus Regiella endosymbiont of Tuberolachnus salignus TaxID=3077956 RepID=UPI0030D5E9FD
MDQNGIDICQRWFREFWGQGIASVVDEIAIADVKLSYPLMGCLKGREPLKTEIKSFHQCFSGSSFNPIGRFIAGDTMIVRWKVDTFYSGVFGGLPEATGKKIHFTGISILRVVDGKIAEDIGEEDRLAIVQQINSKN